VAFALSATAFAALFAVAFITDSSASIWFSWYGIPDLLLSPNKIKGTSNESCQRILLAPNFECLPCLVSTERSNLRNFGNIWSILFFLLHQLYAKKENAF
jgi:hypothetical protein